MTINEYRELKDSIKKQTAYTSTGRKIIGSRNIAEAHDIMIKNAVCKATKATAPHVGWYCFRRIGYNFGTKRYPDIRRMNDVFKIAKITDKMVIGTSGERCLKSYIIRVFKEV